MCKTVVKAVKKRRTRGAVNLEVNRLGKRFGILLLNMKSRTMDQLQIHRPALLVRPDIF